MKKIFYTLFIISLMFTTGCEDTLYDAYNNLTGPVESVALPKTASIVINATERLDARVYPSLTENKNVTWTSVNGTGQIDIDQSGNVKGVALGDATVTVTTEEGGKTAVCMITVVPAPIPITSLTLPETLSIGTGQQRTLLYSYTPSDATKATNSNMTWKSSNAAVVAVDGDGNVTGVSNGTAIVTVKSTEWDKSATCTVTVSEPTYTVTYKKNDGTPDEVVDSTRYKSVVNFTVYPVNTFVRTHYTFTGWTTGADGSGTPYTSGAEYPMGSSSIILYAQWSAVPYTVTYNASDKTTGNIPVDSTIYYIGNSVTVKTSFSSTAGSLAKINSSGVSYRCAGWSDGTTTYLEGASFPITSNVTLTAVWAAYALRDVGPSGGLIFYVKTEYSDGWRYMEAAPSDQGAGVIWQTGELVVTDTTAAGIGDGLLNTNTIVETELPGQTTIAAYICYNLTVGVYGDWFLPSIGELSKMQTELHANPYHVGSFLDNWVYWSSTEVGPTQAKSLQFYSTVSTSYDRLKNSTSPYVRAARRF